MQGAAAAAAPEQAEPEFPPYVEPEFPPLPHNSWAPWLIESVELGRAGEERPLTLNFAGEHSSGWEIYDVDEENLITWCAQPASAHALPWHNQSVVECPDWVADHGGYCQHVASAGQKAGPKATVPTWSLV